MKDYQQQFIQLALDCQALRFGEFTLKSGRISPYFFNAGLFNSGAALAKLGQFFAKAIEDAKLDYDILFGPAYKGIPLASATSIALAEHFQKDIPYCFNRKEAKDHGEGGNLVGAPLQGKTLIIDDVITAGTAKREAIAIIEAAQAEFAGIVIALDRKERGQGEHSAIQELQQQYDVPVVSIISLDNIIEYLEQQGSEDVALDKILTYRNEYGV